MVAAITVVIGAMRLGIEPLSDAIGDVAATSISYLVLFGTMALVARWSSHRYGTGDVRRDLGLSFWPADIWCFAGGALLWVLEVILVILIHLGDVPMRSNGEVVAQIRDRPALFAVLVIAAVIGAPIFEELAFRGVIQRAFASRLHPAWAIAAASLIFGVYHLTPGFGSGNVGMILVLTVIGAALGALAQLTGRLAPSMFAHAGLNAIVITLVWITAPEFV
jgi:membrane protease YdiL (CAAX protease family)